MTGVQTCALPISKVLQLFQEAGGELILNSEVEKITLSHGEISNVTINKEKYTFDYMVWTAPLSEICHLMKIPDEALRYLHLILFNVMVDEPPPTTHQWCYFGGYDTTFARTSVPVNFSPHCAPQGKHGCCVEVTCKSFDDSRWKTPEALTEDVIRQMVHTGLISSADKVLDVRIEKIPHSYPIYELNYLRALDTIMKEVKGYKKLIVTGRTGTFWYNNMDHSIKSGIETASAILHSHEAVEELPFRENFFS